MASINVYAEKVVVEGESVYLERVDPGQVVAELNARDVLEALDFSDIIDYVAEVRAEEADE